MTKLTFGDLPLGARFTFLGVPFVKLAPGMAEDKDRNGTIFQAQTMVEADDCAERRSETGENPS